MSCHEPPISLPLHLCILNRPCHILLRKHHMQQEKQPKKKIPWRKNPTMLPWQIMPGTASLLVAGTPQPPWYPAWLFQDIPSALSSSAPGAGRAGGCLHLSPQMPAPAGCFVSVALLPDLSCFLPCGCNWRKSLAVSQLQGQAGDSAVAVLCPGTYPPWQ